MACSLNIGFGTTLNFADTDTVKFHANRTSNCDYVITANAVLDLSAKLTGLVIPTDCSNIKVTSRDSVISAIGKLQGQINCIVDNGVQSVTDDGNGVVVIDNSDPRNPVARFGGVFVDGTTITGDGSQGNPLVATAGTSFISSVANTVTIDLSVSVGGQLTANLNNTTVTANSYGDATHVAAFTVDAQGRLTAASNVAITYPSQFISSVADTNTIDLTVSVGGQLTADVRHQNTATITLSDNGSGLKADFTSMNISQFTNDVPYLTGLTGWALGGNTVGSEKKLGTIDNFELPIITNNIERGRWKTNGILLVGSSASNGAIYVQDASNVNYFKYDINGGLVLNDLYSVLKSNFIFQAFSNNSASGRFFNATTASAGISLTANKNVAVAYDDYVYGNANAVDGNQNHLGEGHISMKVGATLPTTSYVGGFLMYANLHAGAGTTAPFFRCEDGTIIDLEAVAAGSFSNPMTTLGDIIYGGVAGTATRLAGDTSDTRKFLRELSVTSVATVPVWDTLQAGDIPDLSGTYLTIDGATVGATSQAQVFTSGIKVDAITNNTATDFNINIDSGSFYFIKALGNVYTSINPLNKQYIFGLTDTGQDNITIDGTTRLTTFNVGSGAGWAMDGSINAFYPIVDGSNIGISGTNRIGTIYMASTIDYVSTMNFSVSGVPVFVLNSTGQVTTGEWTATAIAITSGGTGATSASAARTNLGATTVGGNIFTATNPSAITFLRVNADNSVSLLDAATFRTAIGAGTGGGTVTSVTGTTNRITSSGGATPAIDISASYVGQTSITTVGTLTTGTASTGFVIDGVTMTLGSDATGDIYYRAATTGVLTRLAIGGANTVLHGGTTPSYSAIVNADITNATIDLTAKVTGILPVANGGTGANTLTAHAVILGNGTSAVAFATIGTAGKILIDQGSGSDPAFTTMSGDITITSAGVTAIGANKVTTTTINAAAVTYAKIQNASANTFLANNTSGAATLAETTFNQNAVATYSGSITWTGGAAPSGTPNHQFWWKQVGSLVTLTISLFYATPGTTDTQVQMVFPAGVPAPVAISGTGTNDKTASGFGWMDGATGGSPPACRVWLVNLGSGSYAINVVAASQSSKVVYATVIYSTN